MARGFTVLLLFFVCLKSVKPRGATTGIDVNGGTSMSIHPSLKTKGAVSERRNVLKRYERIDQLKKEGRYKDGDRAWGLPKTKPEL